ncbi:hypothetical protein [Bradyrhizobium sp. UFLA05-153]
MNASCGHHVPVELIGRQGTVVAGCSIASALQQRQPGDLLYPDNWVLRRFEEMYRRQMAEWVSAAKAGTSGRPNVWDTYVASAVAEQVAELSPEMAWHLLNGPRRCMTDR